MGRSSTTKVAPAPGDPHVTAGAAINPMPPKPRSPASSHTINAIRELYRQRVDLLNAEGTLTRQIRAICRRAVGCTPEDPPKLAAEKLKAADALYDQLTAKSGGVLVPIMAKAVGPLTAARNGISSELSAIEKMLNKQAMQLPVYESFVVPLKGFSALGLAKIIGEAGDIGQYANPAKLWKRMGMAVIGGERQRKCTDATKAAAHGYSPRRRAVMFVIGDTLLRQKNAMKDLYDARKLVEIAKAEAEGLIVAPSAKIPVGKAAQYRSQGHIHNRACRYVQKRLLRDLWRAWRHQIGDPLPAA